MKNIPLELWTYIAEVSEPHDLMRFSFCCKFLYETLIPLAYKRYIKSESSPGSTCLDIILKGTEENEAGAITSLERAVEAGASLRHVTDLPIPTFYPLDDQPDPSKNRTDDIYASLLGLAASRNQRKVVTFLHESGIHVDWVPRDPNFKNVPGIYTPLFIAIAKGHEQTVTTLLELGAAIVPPNRFKISALHVAAATGFPNLVCFMNERSGVNPDIKDLDRRSPLIYAMKSKTATTPMIQKLLDYSAGVDVASLSDALLLACYASQWDIAAQLLDHGAHPEKYQDRSYCCPLIRVAKSDGQPDVKAHSALIIKLVDHGANPNLEIVGRFGREPLLTFLIHTNRDRQAGCLLQCLTLDIEQPDGKGKRALEYVLSTAKSGRTALAEQLLARGARLPEYIIDQILSVAYEMENASQPRINELNQQHPNFRQMCSIICNYPPKHTEQAEMKFLGKFAMDARRSERIASLAKTS